MSVTLHIGLHKTATTTLQTQFFPACTGIDYLRDDDAANKLVHEATTQDPIYYDATKHRLIAERPILISREALSGALLAGNAKRGLDHRLPILQNLKASVPGARIILVIRRQDRLAVSLYRQYLKIGGTETIEAFLGRRGAPILPPDRFRFLPYVDRLKEMFPAVLVLAFEEFADSQMIFLEKLADFLGVPVPRVELKARNETRLGSGGLEATRIMNRVFKSRLNATGLLPSVMPAIQDKWLVKGVIRPDSRIQRTADAVLESVRDENRQLDRKYGLGLGSYGYY